jgi:5-carboxyvanillate decarboxylase
VKKIAIEEHFLTESLVDYLRSRKEWPRWEVVEGEEIERVYWAPSFYMPMNPALKSGLLDIEEIRLRHMDEVGIDMQVLSLSAPGVESLPASDGTSLAKRINDEVANIVKKYPKRFASFAAIAPQDPGAAANELERAVKDLGLKGAVVNSHIRGEYLDNQKFWVIFEKAERLGVPIYLHPREPSPDMIKPYLVYPALASAMWGFGAETGLHAMRLICSGVFDKYPGLKIILGHLGEAIPYWLWRIDNFWLMERKGMAHTYSSVSKSQKKPSQYFKDNFYVTTSGMFWQPPLMCAYLVLGADRILFAVDYPYELNREGVQFMDSLPICDDDKEKIYHRNAEKLLGL